MLRSARGEVHGPNGPSSEYWRRDFAARAWFTHPALRERTRLSKVDVPPEPVKSIEKHEEDMERSLGWLEQAVNEGATEAETYREIARSVRGTTEALFVDVKRLTERASFFEHHGPTKRTP